MSDGTQIQTNSFDNKCYIIQSNALIYSTYGKI